VSFLLLPLPSLLQVLWEKGKALEEPVQGCRGAGMCAPEPHSHAWAPPFAALGCSHKTPG